MRIDIWHNIMWSKYKARVFSEVYRISQSRGLDCRFFQIAESDIDRLSLAPVDRTDHQYPYTLLFAGAYSRIPRLKLYSRIFWATVRSDADIIVLAGYHKPEYWMQLLISRMRRKRVLVFCDSTASDRPQSGIKNWLKAIFFGNCDRVLCYGVRSRDYIHSFGVPFSRISIRCQAAALPDGYSAAEALRLRKLSAGERVQPRYLYVGRLSPEKNIDVLIRAFQRVLPDQPAAGLVIVGSGPQEAELKEIATNIPTRTAVQFLGTRSGQALVDEYLKASCLVLPSRSEPWGLVVNEALSYGCPVVVSDRCGCVPELVIDGQTGWVVKCGDVDDLAEKMLMITDKSIDAGLQAERCIEQIRPYSSVAAAESILAGCALTMNVELLAQAV